MNRSNDAEVSTLILNTSRKAVGYGYIPKRKETGLLEAAKLYLEILVLASVS